jgi:hypothetical protein
LILAATLGVTAAVDASAPTRPVAVTPTLTGDLTEDAGIWTAGPHGGDVLLSANTRVRLAPMSVVRSYGRPTRLYLGPEGQVRTHVLDLRAGRVDVLVAEDAGSARQAVMVQTPHGLAGIGKGGHLTIVTRKERSIVANHRGAAITVLEGRWQRLAEGKLVRTHGNGTSEEPSGLLEAPSPLRGRRVWLSTDTKGGIGPLEWTDVPGAARYLLQIGEGDELSTTMIETAETRVGAFLAGAGAGQHTVRVAAVDPDGIVGIWSDAVPFRVVGVALPRGAYMDPEGAARIGRDQQVRLSHATGLLMNHDGSPDWIPVPNGVALGRTGETVVHLGMPEYPGSATLRLRQRNLSTRVTAGPKLVRWPGEPVVLTVHLVDDEGRPLPIWVKPRIEVRVGLEKVAVTWHREGMQLRATVPPRADSGPWVVWVEVFDQFDQALGRDFVEVAAR